MADQLYLSLLLRGYTEANMLRHFGAMLRLFPFSRLWPACVLRIWAVDTTEPIQFERGFEEAAAQAEILDAAKEFIAPDVGVLLEAKWDLWQYAGDWKLAPATVGLWCYGPEFGSSDGDHLRIDFGIDTLFLPQPDLPGSVVPIQSNIKSLLHLVHELDNQLNVESRRLWTESGENFAERLQQALSEVE